MDNEAQEVIARYVDPTYKGVLVDTQAVMLPFNCPVTRMVVIRTRPHRMLCVRIVDGDSSLPIASDSSFNYKNGAQEQGELRIKTGDNGVGYLHIGPSTKMMKTTIKVSDLTSHTSVQVTSYDPNKEATEHASSS
jgi:hypothetical protein